MADSPPYADVDHDGLEDAWEDALLETWRPAVVLPQEDGFFSDPHAVSSMVGRVAPRGPDQVLLTLMLGYSRDYGRCGVSGHPGDSERVALLFDRKGEDVTLLAIYTAAHEGEWIDAGNVTWDPATLTWHDTPSGPRWVVFASRDKHASFPSAESCRASTSIPCLRETCVPLSEGRVLTSPVVNAGEPGAPRMDALDAIGFPGDHAWSGGRFCGGRDERRCSAPVREKLLADPFDAGE